MQYRNIKSGIFQSRPNRFVAYVEIDGVSTICHVKNTGRCKELLIPGVMVYVQKSDNPARKTMYSLIAVCKGNRLINMDSQAPNKVVYEWLVKGNLFQNLITVKPEQIYGDSRFDFYVETEDKKIYMEVKGVTLEEEGETLFPDAPTKRGVKHIRELCKCLEDGIDAYILFVIQMEGVKLFKPNDKTHLEFGQALRKAESKGVHILALDCIVTKDSLTLNNYVPIKLS